MHNFCPFARRVVAAGGLHCQVADDVAIQPALHSLAAITGLLNTDHSIETALLIYPQGFARFTDYLDLCAAAEQLFSLSGYAGVYQIASFHPHYCFAGAGEGDAANYTNRSPYPMLHLLREGSVTAALAQYPHPENIPQANMRRARKLGTKALDTLLHHCYSG